MATDKNQYLWLNSADPNLSAFEEEARKELGKNFKRVPTVDYAGPLAYLGIINILMGIIWPFIIPAPNPEIYFLMIPCGVFVLAVHIFSVDKTLPAGCIPGKTYYKYKVTFI